ncbi:MAG: fused MFS/spermidine synthase [Sulfuritalea sp.]|jgi:hypothetical protein|nr:fused MFS/spermidine synthase [Sulfuritalea sp.]
MPALIALTVFLSAFLLFMVQPLIAKQILPWFGGSAGVWTTCLVFFQALLLGGYAYAHSLVRYMSPRSQALAHSLLLAASLLALPILADSSWQPVGDEQPIPRIMALLVTTVGLPYFLLSATGPLAQAWYSRRLGRVPWRLFALSNLGSLAALLAYPFVVEPWISTRVQALVWSAGFAVFAVLCAAVAWRGARTGTVFGAETVPDDGEPGPSRGRRLLWIMLAAVGSALLLAVSNHMTQNLASVPFLWIVPLSIYLLTFVLCFDSEGWYRRPLFLIFSALLIPAMGWLLDSLNLVLAIPVYLVGLFALCMFCHGELARLKPAPQYLTGFYLSLSAGGVAGGLLVGIVAPYVFGGYYELGFALVACALLALWQTRELRSWIPAAFTYVALAAGWFTYSQIETATGEGVVIATRNFYGAIRVKDYGPPEYIRTLRHGPILHGGQWFQNEVTRRQPHTYYSTQSGFGLALGALQSRGSLHIGVIGLGAGSIAAWGRQGDRIRFYEIDPAVIAAAKSGFRYLDDSAARVDVVLGDARLSLQRESPQDFDLLVIDAFSGDSIPAHLLTVEAMDVYLRHLKADGALLYHATNRYLDIASVVRGLADRRGLGTLRVFHDGGAEAAAQFVFASEWVLVGGERTGIDALAVRQTPAAARLGEVAWTDDYNNLLGILKPRY